MTVRSLTHPEMSSYSFPPSRFLSPSAPLSPHGYALYCTSVPLVAHLPYHRATAESRSKIYIRVSYTSDGVLEPFPFDFNIEINLEWLILLHTPLRLKLQQWRHVDEWTDTSGLWKLCARGRYSSLCVEHNSVPKR